MPPMHLPVYGVALDTSALTHFNCTRIDIAIIALSATHRYAFYCPQHVTKIAGAFVYMTHVNIWLSATIILLLLYAICYK